MSKTYRLRHPISIISWWEKHQFKVLVVGSIILIGLLYFFNTDNNGSWSLEYSYLPIEKKPVAFKKHSKGELECRRVMEKLFERPFPNMRPQFLMNKVTNKPLEIDCCNMELKLGVEYNGKQHYQYVKGMHKNFEQFRTQQYRDLIKEQLCRENDFKLISVPYYIPIDKIERYLLDELKKLGYEFYK